MKTIYLIKKFFGKLIKRQTDEIGTLKSPTKPLYIAKQNVENLKAKKEELEKLVNTKFEIEREIKEKQKEVIKEEETLKILQEIDNNENQTKLEKEKIKIYIESKKELEKDKENVESELKNVKEIGDKPKIFWGLYILPIIFIIITIILFGIKKSELGIVGAVLGCVSFAIIIFKNAKIKKEYENELNEIIRIKQEIENKKRIIEVEINSKDKLIIESQNLIEMKKKLQKEQIYEKYPNASKLCVEGFENKSNILEEQNYINELKLNITQKEYIKSQIIEKLEELVEIEEKLNVNVELLKELLEYDEAINIAKEALDEAHLKMKESITPKFTENLSKSINIITAGKYKKVKVNEENGLILEAENRQLYNIKLS